MAVLGLVALLALCIANTAQAGRGGYHRARVPRAIARYLRHERRLRQTGELQPGAGAYYLPARLSNDGSKPKGTVLIMHGVSSAPPQSKRMAKRLADEGYNVLALRHAGHGYQDAEGLRAPERMPKYHEYKRYTKKAEEALEMLASEGGKVNVVGLSLGGAVASWLLAYHPDKIDKVQLYAPFLQPASHSLRRNARFAMFMDRISGGLFGRLLDHIQEYKGTRQWSGPTVDKPGPGYRGGRTLGQLMAVFQVAKEAREGLERLSHERDRPEISLIVTDLDETADPQAAIDVFGRKLGAQVLRYPAEAGVLHGMWERRESTNRQASNRINPDLAAGFLNGDPSLIDRHLKSGVLIRDM